MLSIIICSAKRELLTAISENIHQTVGVCHEIIGIDNSVKNKGICCVYNEGAALARYNNLCFVHEDVLFHSKDWGLILLTLLEDEHIGIVGTVGCAYKSAIPSTWAMSSPEYYRANNIQRWNGKQTSKVLFKSDSSKHLDEVVILDGVFLAMRKDVWCKYNFNELDIKGFHFYDYDICLRVLRDFSLIVCYDILLEHFSEGNLTRAWFEQCLWFHRKYRNEYPCTHKSLNLSKKKIRKEEDSVLEALCFLLVRLKSNYVYYYILKMFLREPLNRRWLKVVYYRILQRNKR